MDNHDMEVENKEELDESHKTRMNNKKPPNFRSSTLRRIAFMKHVRLRSK